MADRFIVLLFVTCSIAIGATVVSLRKSLPSDSILKIAVAFSLALIPAAGLIVGTFYSHGFVIPWWVFGGVNSAVFVLLVLITSSLFKLAIRLRKE